MTGPSEVERGGTDASPPSLYERLLALSEVAREAAAQIAWLDRHEPGHRLATRSAGEHHHPGVYAMLGRQTAAHLQMHAPQTPQTAHE